MPFTFNIPPKNVDLEQLQRLLDYDDTTAQVRENRFRYDHTLFLMGRVLESLRFFCTLKRDESILSILKISSLYIDETLKKIDQLEDADKVNRVDQLHTAVIREIKKELPVGMSMSDFYSFGQMELLYRHRQNRQSLSTNVPQVIEALGACDVAVELIATLLRKELEGEPGKAGLAEEILNPEKPHMTVKEYRHHHHTILEIIKVEKFYCPTHPTLTNVQIQEYKDLLDESKAKPFWFQRLSPSKQFYIVTDLLEMQGAVVIRDVLRSPLKSGHAPVRSKVASEVFSKRIIDKYGNTSAKGREFPGLSGLRRKTKWLYEKQRDESYLLLDKQEPEPHHFTSAGSPVNLKSHIADEQVEFAAKNIARMLPVIKDRRAAWLKENFGQTNIDVDAVYLVITSLVSPLTGQGKLADFLSHYITEKKTADVVQENNEEMMVRSLKRAVDYINHLGSRGELFLLNDELRSTDMFICDLAIFGINKFGRWFSSLQSRKNLYQTGPMTAFHALTHDVQLFLDDGHDALPTCLRDIYKALIALDFNHGLAFLDPKPIEALTEAYDVLKNDQDPRMTKLSRRIRAALIFLKIASTSDMNIIAAAMFEKINPGTTYTACKSSHDRKEHLDLVSESIDVVACLLGELPDPTKDAHMSLLAKIVFQKKFEMQSPSHSRALSANNIGLKSHDSVDVFAPWWKAAAYGAHYEAWSTKFKDAAVQGDFPNVLSPAAADDVEPVDLVHHPEEVDDDEDGDVEKSGHGWFFSPREEVIENVSLLPKYSRYAKELTDEQQFRRALYHLARYEQSVFFCSLEDVMLFIVWTAMVFFVFYALSSPDNFFLPTGLDATMVSFSYFIVFFHRRMINRLDKWGYYLEACAFLNQRIELPPVETESIYQALQVNLILEKEKVKDILVKELQFSVDVANRVLNHYFNGQLNKTNNSWLQVRGHMGWPIRNMLSMLLEVVLTYGCSVIMSVLTQKNVAIVVLMAVKLFLFFHSRFNSFRNMNEKCVDQITIGGKGAKILGGIASHKIGIFGIPHKAEREFCDGCFKL